MGRSCPHEQRPNCGLVLAIPSPLPWPPLVGWEDEATDACPKALGMHRTEATEETQRSNADEDAGATSCGC